MSSCHLRRSASSHPTTTTSIHSYGERRSDLRRDSSTDDDDNSDNESSSAHSQTDTTQSKTDSDSSCSKSDGAMKVDNEGQSSSDDEDHSAPRQVIRPSPEPESGSDDKDHLVPRKASCPTQTEDEHKTIHVSQAHADDVTTMDSASASAIPAVPSVTSGSDIDPTIALLAISGKIEFANANIASSHSVKECAPSTLASSNLGQTGAVALSPGPGNFDHTDLHVDDQDKPGHGTYIFLFHCTILNCLNIILDKNSPSPSRFELQGSSRTTGGIF